MNLERTAEIFLGIPLKPALKVHGEKVVCGPCSATYHSIFVEQGHFCWFADLRATDCRDLEE
jgi:hypothetical protein